VPSNTLHGDGPFVLGFHGEKKHEEGDGLVHHLVTKQSSCNINYYFKLTVVTLTFQRGIGEENFA
jgi:hypothetical protein